MKTITKEIQEHTTPLEALEVLKQGNKRFIKNISAPRDLLQQVNETVTGQWPLTTILSCIDSRVPIELIFDQGIGDIFSIRMAGNVVNADIVGSMEFACKIAGSKLIVVMGHTNCGAIKGACDHVEMGNLTGLLAKIQPAIYEEKSTTNPNTRNSSNSTFVEKVSIINVKRSVNSIIERSSVLQQMIERGEIGIIGAMYELETGKVHFYPETFRLGSSQATVQELSSNI
ncbi:carbonic anhydrase [Arenibacter sp. 6A1]|uniref:carbonic anhydrase family protein n=1 Tax=Arenibacter sp. 6A1 TaxID=2720391 RepID=UPI00144719A4|nr:carbonic anhydrase family protein [Arenibacter sp. 6A1]NKI28479.1 carbonic anhydrase [Arenibacter sp. 6A1]